MCSFESYEADVIMDALFTPTFRYCDVFAVLVAPWCEEAEVECILC
ncbi:MAG: hypothetical protein HOB13_00940 [Lentimicrobiaceae bacterium]|nr:hypothetical protein [Lentimicrobiaceae bacterium]